MIDVTFVAAASVPATLASHVLDEDEHARWSRLHPTGQPLFLAAHLGARMLVALRISLESDPPEAPDPGEMGWTVGPSGKPRVTFRDGRPQPLHVSVAHGGGLAIAAVCDRGPIGVDVEHVDPRRDVLALARRFFSLEDHAQLAACDGDARVTRFHQLWTRKEAVLKTTGAGLRGGLGVRVDGDPDADGWRRVQLPGHDAPLYVRDLRPPAADVCGAVAIEGQPGEIRSVQVWMDG